MNKEINICRILGSWVNPILCLLGHSKHSRIAVDNQHEEESGGPNNKLGVYRSFVLLFTTSRSLLL